MAADETVFFFIFPTSKYWISLSTNVLVLIKIYIRVFLWWTQRLKLKKENKKVQNIKYCIMELVYQLQKFCLFIL